MENLNKEIGERIRFIRSIFNEGGKLSATQFAHLLGETMHKILNYELGRAQVPPSFLVTLYKRGINPIYILTGEGSIFAPNIAGRELSQKLAPILRQMNIEDFDNRDQKFSGGEVSGIEGITYANVDDLIELAQRYTAVAGDLMEIIRKRSKNE
ncbi:XRE family transcriptional regulator [Bacteroidetes/Chlorobi group bacterium Naka2016]|jgi:hypothetical protein|nr:MAG: XRE family transcriptional regulator [Bacteroidetes/Chlorobi group bacterium Naka2016]